MQINYEKYSLKELLQAKNGIDPEKYPENYKKLMDELGKRDNEIIEHNKQIDKSTLNKLKILGYFQLAAAAVLTLYIGLELIQEFNFIKLLVGVALISLNALAGWGAIRESVLGYRLSLLNQGLQSVIIVTSSFAYNYSGIGGIYIIIREGVNFSATFNPGFNIWFSNVNPPYGFGIDLLALFFILVLLSGIELKEQNHANKQRNTDSGPNAPPPVR